MKIYTNTYDLSQPSEKKFWVAPHSDFKIGIKVIGYKQIQYEKDIWLYDGSKEIPKDSEDNDFVFFKIKSGDTGEVTYTIKIIDGPNTLGLFTLTQVVTDSTVYEQESGGEIPSELDVNNITITNSVEFPTLGGCGGYIDNEEGLVMGDVKVSPNGITLFNNKTIEFSGCYGCTTIGSDKIVMQVSNEYGTVLEINGRGFMMVPMTLNGMNMYILAASQYN